VAINRRMRLMLLGKLCNPQLVCCKGIFDQQVGSVLIPLVVKRQ